MSPKMLAVLVLCALVAWFKRPSPGVDYTYPVPTEERTTAATEKQEFETLFFDQQPLASLATAGSYTVVEVYINTCAICKRIEKQMPALLAARGDVVMRRVHFPEEGMSWPLDQEVTMNARLKDYRICGTPHIEIYKPDGTLLVKDDCGDKHALRFLEAWLADETLSG